jgi:hypothetical protein
MPTDVEVLVYSGRPNPHVTLDAETDAELGRRLAALPPLGQPFTGLRLRGSSASLFTVVEIAGGAVQVHQRTGGTQVLADPGRGLERWLLERIGARIDPDHRALLAEVGRGMPATLTGTWSKTTTAACAEKYPATISFAASTYRGARGPQQGMVWWDAGIYRLEDPQTLVLSVATDELVNYRIDLQADRFEITDSEGCRVTFRRESG